MAIFSETVQPKVVQPETELTLKIQARHYQIIEAALKKLPWEVVNETICIIENQVAEQVK